jgi:hypothetical protein
MESIERRRKQEIKRLGDANWSIKRELGRLVGFVAFSLLALASSSVALIVMWLPINDARDPWQLFTGGNPFGESMYFWGPVVVAVAMFVMMIRGAVSEHLISVPQLRRPK